MLMMNATAVLWVILAIILLDFLLDIILENLNLSYRKKPLPENLKDIYDEKEYKKQISYENENIVLGLIKNFIVTLVTFLLLHYGIFGKLYGWIATIIHGEILSTLAFFAIIGLGYDLLTLPFQLYSIFAIEERYGFNRMTPMLFIKDKFKSWLIGAVIGGILVGGITWFYEITGKWFWIYALILIGAVEIFIAMFYTKVILPLFNKLSPLPAGELREKIEDFARKANFKLENIYVIDSSKRSTKSNAFFSGLGPKKNIILYDTLIEDLTPDEIVAVLAHEVGHYKNRHVLKGVLISLLELAFMLWLLSLFVSMPVLSQALGYNSPSFALGLLAFGILYAPVSFLLSLFTGMISRKFEYQADAFAERYGFASQLVSALKRISRKQLSNLNPHPLYVLFHYSHPPLRDRVKKLEKRN